MLQSLKLLSYFPHKPANYPPFLCRRHSSCIISWELLFLLPYNSPLTHCSSLILSPFSFSNFSHCLLSSSPSHPILSLFTLHLLFSSHLTQFLFPHCYLNLSSSLPTLPLLSPPFLHSTPWNPFFPRAERRMWERQRAKQIIEKLFITNRTI